MIFWGMGISQHIHGTDNSPLPDSLALMTGRSAPGAGLHPLRGQNNVQGASDAGLIPMFLPDYQTVEDDGVRAAFKSLGIGAISSRKGLTVVEIMDAVHAATFAACISGRKPGDVGPGCRTRARRAGQAEHLVVQDIFLTETANYADVILPARLGREDRHRHQHQPTGADGPPGVAAAGGGARGLVDQVELAKRLG